MEGGEPLPELPGTPTPAAAGPNADAAKKGAAGQAPPPASAGPAEAYEPLRGTPLRRPKSYSTLAQPEGASGAYEHEDDHCCPTCLEEFCGENPQIVLQCGHAFHLACIYEWVRSSGRPRSGMRGTSAALRAGEAGRGPWLGGPAPPLS